MNESVHRVAAEYLSGAELSEPLLNNLEVAIRAYGSCLSCAAHAVGKMPLQDDCIDKIMQQSNGKIIRPEE